MKLAVSNLAWPAEAKEDVAKALVAAGVAGIEVAPTKIWPKPLEASDGEIDACRAWWEFRGLKIAAAQALLFGRPELTLFDSAATRRKTIDYLAGIIRICARLGAEALVFGSPKNRAIGTRAPAEVHAIAVDFFGEIGDLAHAAGTHVVLEAIPPENGADYILRAAEALALVREVNHPGFRLHLDTACMTLANDDIAATIRDGLPYLRHFHVSEPAMAAIGTSGRVDHAGFARELAQQRYGHWVSIEMREAVSFTLAGLAECVRFVRHIYVD